MTTDTLPDEPVTAEALIDDRPVTGLVLAPERPTIALPSNDEWTRFAHMANTLADSGILNRALNGRPKAVMAVMLKGRELGLPPMEALNSIYIIEGTPSLSSELMLGLIRTRGHRIWYEATGEDGTATICGQRRYPDGTLDPVIERITWTLDMARTADLLRKDNWKHYPAAMLRARAASALARMSYGEVLMGAVYTPEELGAGVNARGDVESLPSRREAEAAAKTITGGQVTEAVEEQPRQSPVAPGDGSDAYGGVGPDVIEGEVEEPAPPVSRETVWAELEWQARVLGRSLQAHTNRWVSANRKNVEAATDEELTALVADRRPLVAQYLTEHPEAAEAHGEFPPVPDLPPADAETAAEPETETAETVPDSGQEPEAASEGDAETVPDSGQGDAAEPEVVDGVVVEDPPDDPTAEAAEPESETLL